MRAPAPASRLPSAAEMSPGREAAWGSTSPSTCWEPKRDSPDRPSMDARAVPACCCRPDETRGRPSEPPERRVSLRQRAEETVVLPASARPPSAARTRGRGPPKPGSGCYEPLESWRVDAAASCQGLRREPCRPLLRARRRRRRRSTRRHVDETISLRPWQGIPMTGEKQGEAEPPSATSRPDPR